MNSFLPIKLTGPGLLAFALLCGAFSLRMWRRNGIACDELLFLPGTPLEDERQRHGTCCQEIMKLCPCLMSFENSNNSDDYSRLLNVISEEEQLEDFALSSTTKTPTLLPQQHLTTTANDLTESGRKIEFQDDNMQSLVQTSQEAVQDHQMDDCKQTQMSSSSHGITTRTDIAPFPSMNENRNTSLFLVHNFILCKLRQRRQIQQQDSSSLPTIPRIPEETVMDSNFTYSPSGASVLGAALDLSLPVLLNFHLFIAAFNHPRYAGSNTPKIFPCKIHVFRCCFFNTHNFRFRKQPTHLFIFVCLFIKMFL
jgi:hypothetical protein